MKIFGLDGLEREKERIDAVKAKRTKWRYTSYCYMLDSPVQGNCSFNSHKIWGLYMDGSSLGTSNLTSIKQIKKIEEEKPL